MAETGTAGTDVTRAGDVTTTDPEAPDAAAPAGGIGTGPGRLLLWLYGMFTVAALSRSIVQICTEFHHAPLAYLLSAVAGVVYAVILVALVKGGESARRIAMVCCSGELLGVLTVGTLTIADSSAFADSTVWSYYGADYLLLPLGLPVAGLLWLRRSARAREAGGAQAAAQRSGDA
ncbi:hypothetical protein V2S66_13425 [Streptomyces sp. V4-01]|uniref:Integral membrane protein n=1 Tax=Actinacidiphila polyblastidii TaxID=3110430 RepID=A0ABU7PCZ0_9ACTN|nr:hypothetical protein [Streptomyces sp. V4-01]